jgi:UDPglucose 6-dehydrogenase
MDPMNLRVVASIVVVTPTDYGPEKNYFNTTSAERVIEQARARNPTTSISIKSTMPIGFTDRMRDTVGEDNLLFSPEHLREGKALHSNLCPNRIVVGGQSAELQRFAEILRDACLDPEVPVLQFQRFNQKSHLDRRNRK